MKGKIIQFYEKIHWESYLTEENKIQKNFIKNPMLSNDMLSNDAKEIEELLKDIIKDIREYKSNIFNKYIENCVEYRINKKDLKSYNDRLENKKTEELPRIKKRRNYKIVIDLQKIINLETTSTTLSSLIHYIVYILCIFFFFYLISQILILHIL